MKHSVIRLLFSVFCFLSTCGPCPAAESGVQMKRGTAGNIPVIERNGLLGDSGVPASDVLTTNAIVQTMTGDETDKVPSVAVMNAGFDIIKTSVTTASTNDYPVLIKLTQSNGGNVEGPSGAPAYISTNTNVKLFGVRYTSPMPTNQLVNLGMYSTTLWGSELSYGHAYGSGAIFMVTKGSAGLDDEWLPPSGAQWVDFTNSWALFKAAIAPQTPRIVGLQFAIGEEDANNTNNAALYEGRLFSFMTNVCAVLGVTSNELPVAILPVWPELDRVGRDTITQAQSNFVEAWPKAMMIRVDDLEDVGDDVHYNGASQVKIGYRVLDGLNELNGAAHGKELGAAEVVSANTVTAKDRIIYKEKRIEDSFVNAYYPPISRWGVKYYNRFEGSTLQDKISGIVPSTAGAGTVAAVYQDATRGAAGVWTEPAQIVLTNGAAFAPGTNSFWFAFWADGASVGQDYWLSVDGATTENPRWLFYLKVNELRFSFYNNSASSTTNRVHYTYSADCNTPAVWVLNVDTTKTNAPVLYRNGVDVGLPAIVADINPTLFNLAITNNILIGGDSTFSGKLDDLTYGVGRALTGAEVTNITERIIAGLPPLQD